MRIVFSGGGTGGHVFPAIAIANAIKNKEPEAEILFVGAKGKIEEEKVPKAGYPIKTLWISGFHRRWTLKNLLFPVKLIWSLVRSFVILTKFRPDVVVGVGGYASGPILQIASMLGIPSLIQEQNSYPGITNKLLAKRVNKICVAYDGMDRFFPKDKIIKTGNPIRQIFIENKWERADAKQKLGFESNRPLVVIIGGSLGARTLNESIMSAELYIKKNNNIQWLWQAGKMYITEYSICNVVKEPQIQIKDFLDRMDLVYAAADLVIARAGALSVSELELLGKACILVPSPNVAEDHQTKNAMALVSDDAAKLVKDTDARKTLIKTAIELLNDEASIAELEKNIAERGIPDAADRIAEEVLQLIKK